MTRIPFLHFDFYDSIPKIRSLLHRLRGRRAGERGSKSFGISFSCYQNAVKCFCKSSTSVTCFLAFLTLTSWLAACQVPVFRYAFERWVSDNYEILIIHDGALREVDHDRIDLLKESAGQTANVLIRSVDIHGAADTALAELWKTQNDSKNPVMAILYPQGARDVPDRLMHVGSFDDGSAKSLFESPLRTEMAKRLEAGQSAVWVFVASGHTEKDALALETLNRNLLRCQQELKLPPIEDLELEDAVAKEKAGQMRVEFSTITLNRDDLMEQFPLKMLLASEDDLATSDQPLAFPVFGRGRVLYALVGKGINDEMIHRACQFMVGPCSCQVKAQNPGFDLLMKVDWEKAVGDVLLSDPLPDSSSEPVLLKIPAGRKAK